MGTSETPRPRRKGWRGLIDRMRGAPVGVKDTNIVGDAGPTDVPPGADPGRPPSPPSAPPSD